jgi:pyrimidine-nucleoside phosphorylase
VSLPQELIRKKRGGETLTKGDLDDFFGGFLAGKVADYQMAAMLMAITLKGMTRQETADLTRLMRDSGETLEWGFPRQLVVDKHSTGGVGDKTSMLLVPLVIDEGVKVPMMAGRGLGHTGGTLDKLEGVGWKVYVPTAKAREQVASLGGVVMGQTETLAPLDRRLYAMRDVTATVESIPLIVGSILSKKLAEGLGGLVMDVKFGSGAFMPTLADARALAVALKDVGAECGVAVRCLLTSMESPLGRTAGNALEVLETVEILRGGGPDDVRELTLELGVEMVRLAFPERSVATVRAALERRLADGSAYRRFLDLARAQGADVSLYERPGALTRAARRVQVPANADGVIAAIDVRALGVAVVELGGGRRSMTDRIDPWVGLSGLKHKGERVTRGEPLAEIHAADDAAAAKARATVEAAYEIAPGGKVEAAALIAERL